MIFDSHAHYDDKAFDIDRDTLIPQLFSNGTGRYKSTLCKLYQVSYTLAAAGIVTRSEVGQSL